MPSTAAPATPWAWQAKAFLWVKPLAAMPRFAWRAGTAEMIRDGESTLMFHLARNRNIVIERDAKTSMTANEPVHSNGIFGSDPSETLLSGLFVDRFGGAKAWEKLKSFLSGMGRTELPFDLLRQIRKHEYPGYPTYEDGLPAVYYYFVPDSGWGSDRAFPSDPLNPAFVRSMDGFGLNLGCPLRLQRAIEVLERLPAEEQRGSRDGLASSTKHLSTIEELLWVDAWQDPVGVHRIVETTTKTYDWSVEFKNVSLRIECKFRPSDWPRLIDGPSHIPLPGALTGKAGEQLGTPKRNETNVLAVTGIAPLTDEFRSFCCEELTRASNIGALVYRRFVGETSVFSLDAAVAVSISQKIPLQEAQPFQPFYSMFTHRAEAARRQKRRQTSKRTKSAASCTNLTEVAVPSLAPRKIFQQPPLPYHCNLAKRLPSGEPVFQHVPPYLVP
jgi:hypothetical protein